MPVGCGSRHGVLCSEGQWGGTEVCHFEVPGSLCQMWPKLSAPGGQEFTLHVALTLSTSDEVAEPFPGG